MRATPMLASFLIAMGLASAPTGAQANLILNGGFEAPVLANGEPRNFYPASIPPLPDWTVVNNVLLLQTNVAEIPNGITRFNAYEGLNSLDLTGSGNVGTTAGITQQVNTIAGVEYTLSFFVGRATPNQGYTGVNYYTNEAIADLSIDGGSRISFTNSDITNTGGLNVNWKEFSYTFTASSNLTTIAFYNGQADPFTNFVGLDDVRLNAVPEPASMAMAATGVLALALVRCARRRRSAS